MVLGGPEAGAQRRRVPQAGRRRGGCRRGGGDPRGARRATSDARGLEGLERIRGIVFRRRRRPASRHAAATADPAADRSLPWPDREAIDLERLPATPGRPTTATRSVSLITARGCPYTCTWCSPRGLRSDPPPPRTVADVADEVAWHRRTLRARPPVVRRRRVHPPPTVDRCATPSELERRGLRVPFECISRADRINEEIADALAAMGCVRLWIGAESGSQRVLDAMRRLTTAEDVQIKTAMLQARGIEVGMFIMLGYDGEEDRDLEATVEHLKRAAPDIFLTTVAYPISGTAYYDRVARPDAHRPAVGRAAPTATCGIAGRHSRRYYEHATRWMVNEVALHRARRLGSAGTGSAGADVPRRAAGPARACGSTRRQRRTTVRATGGRGWRPRAAAGSPRDAPGCCCTTPDRRPTASRSCRCRCWRWVRRSRDGGTTGSSTATCDGSAGRVLDAAIESRRRGRRARR